MMSGALKLMSSIITLVCAWSHPPNWYPSISQLSGSISASATVGTPELLVAESEQSLVGQLVGVRCRVRDVEVVRVAVGALALDAQLVGGRGGLRRHRCHCSHLLGLHPARGHRCDTKAHALSGECQNRLGALRVVDRDEGFVVGH